MKNIILLLLFWGINVPAYTQPKQSIEQKIITNNRILTLKACSERIMDLRDTLLQAQANDPVYRQAKANYQAEREVLPQSIAKYLPNAHIEGSILRYRDKTTAVPSYPEEALGVVKYPVENYTLTITQPLFNYTNLILIKKAQAQVKQFYYHYRAAYQDLVIRNSRAYFALLQAQNELASARQKAKSSFTVFNQAKERLRVGVIAKSIYNDAEADYDRDVSLVLSKENELADKKEDLRKITGLMVDRIAPLKAKIPFISPQPNSINYWEVFTARNNQEIKAAHYGTLAAKQELESEKGKHLPYINAVATFNKYREGSQGYGPFAYTRHTAGVEFNFPLLEGGNVLSLSRQAQHEYESAAAKEEEIRRTNISLARKAFLSIELGIAKIQADLRALRSGESSVKSNLEAFRVGLRNITEVIDAQSRLYASRVTYSEDQIDYILNHLQLRQAAGTLSPKDIDMVNSWLAGEP